MVLDAVSGSIAAFSVAIVDCDMAVAMGRQGFETRSWGVCRGAMIRPDRVWHCFHGVFGWFGEGVAAVVAIVNDDVAHGGCANVDSGDMAALTRVLGCISRVCIAISMVLGVVWVVELMLGVVIAFFSEWECSSSGSSGWRAAH
jgi:hypothetical protein